MGGVGGGARGAGTMTVSYIVGKFLLIYFPADKRFLQPGRAKAGLSPP